MLKWTLGSDKLDCIAKFLRAKHPTAVLTPSTFKALWQYWASHKFSANEMSISFEEYASLVNENTNGKTL